MKIALQWQLLKRSGDKLPVQMHSVLNFHQMVNAIGPRLKNDNNCYLIEITLSSIQYVCRIEVSIIRIVFLQNEIYTFFLQMNCDHGPDECFT
jgi:hypothetical protein